MYSILISTLSISFIFFQQSNAQNACTDLSGTNPTWGQCRTAAVPCGCVCIDLIVNGPPASADPTTCEGNACVELTCNPTTNPTLQPTENPTMQPTENPTENPTTSTTMISTTTTMTTSITATTCPPCIPCPESSSSSSSSEIMTTPRGRRILSESASIQCSSSVSSSSSSEATTTTTTMTRRLLSSSDSASSSGEIATTSTGCVCPAGSYSASESSESEDDEITQFAKRRANENDHDQLFEENKSNKEEVVYEVNVGQYTLINLWGFCAVVFLMNCIFCYFCCWKGKGNKVKVVKDDFVGGMP